MQTWIQLLEACGGYTTGSVVCIADDLALALLEQGKAIFYVPPAGHEEMAAVHEEVSVVHGGEPAFFAHPELRSDEQGFSVPASPEPVQEEEENGTW